MTRAEALARAETAILQTLSQWPDGATAGHFHTNAAFTPGERTDEGVSTMRIIDATLQRLKRRKQIEFRRTSGCWHKVTT